MQDMSDQKTPRDSALRRLFEDYKAGKVTRRQFTERAAFSALGVGGAAFLANVGSATARPLGGYAFAQATPEQELGRLPLGSRPAKRRAGGVESLRAIPWIFAWTQTRLMLPAWLGWETALGNALQRGEQALLEDMRERWPFFRTRIDMLEMVLAKTDLSIAALYDERLVDTALRPLGAQLRDLLSQCRALVLGLTHQSELLTHSPETREAITVRNIYLDPLHLLQAELLVAAEDFPAARRALGDVATRHPTQRSLAILAAIARGEGAEDSTVREIVTRAIAAPRGPQWVCDKCQAVHGTWHPVCDNCGGFDTLSWREPPETAAASPALAELLPLMEARPPLPPEPEPPVEQAPLDEIARRAT